MLRLWDTSEYASDEEEDMLYVTLDLGSIEPSLGLDTPAPFLKLSGTILKGRHKTLLGSEILFTDPPDKRSLTPLMPPTTSTRICFSKVCLLPKGTVAPSPSSVLSVSPSMTTTMASTLSTTSFHLDPSLAPPGPCTTSTSKRRTRKGKDQDAQESWHAAADAASLLLDHVTGKNAPRARVPRTSAVSIRPHPRRTYPTPHPCHGSRVLRPPRNKTPTLHSPPVSIVATLLHLVLRHPSNATLP
ncbi:hypothetical protein DXG01_012320 [Tephrocybe rancida]|nr:hypothetical protein DXG01_012320 [Tephrocybe rancida]